MARKRIEQSQSVELREFRSPDEIDSAIRKLERRIQEVAQIDPSRTVSKHTGEDEIAASNIKATILEVFGPNSPEFGEHKHISVWSGSLHINMHPSELVQGIQRGQAQVIGILNGLIGRLKEKREDIVGGAIPAPSSYLDLLNLHPRIRDVARDRFFDGYPWDAVFAAAKALVNYIKERSGQHGLDGAPLVRSVFSRNEPILAFNNLADQTDRDEQEGMMHLFEGAVLGIRNPGGHAFPEGPDQRAIEYISFLSLLAYRVQEAKRLK